MLQLLKDFKCIILFSLVVCIVGNHLFIFPMRKADFMFFQ